MKKIIYKISVLISAVLLLSACNLDEYNPAAGDASLKAFSAWSGLETNCYSPLYSQMFSATDYLSVAECGTDMWLVKANGTSTKELFYYESLTTSTNGTNKLFKQCYSMISSCNSVINEAPNLIDGDTASVRILTAEAKCLRAYYYLVLVTQFGPVTLNLSDVGVADLNPKRATEAEIYAQIVKDLKEAATNLGVTPYQDNYARVTKKSALGLLARAYAQGAGLDLTENGKSYWQRAKEVAEDLITNAGSYGAYLYTDISDMWADANNRNNKEALFIAAGPQAGEDDAFNYASGANKLYAYTCGDPGQLTEFWNSNHKPSDKGYFYGRMNSSTYMPSKYLMDCFNPTWDKRWENTFQYAYSEWTMVQPAWVAYDKGTITITQAMIDKYKLNPALLGQKYYPYADCNAIASTYGGNQYPASVWPKGDHTGDITKLEHPKKVYVVDYPVASDDDRFSIVCSKEHLTASEKLNYRYFIVNIDDLYDSNGLPWSSASTSFDPTTNAYLAYPSLNKFNWSYQGVFSGSNLQVKYGDMYIMRMAEVYLIAAEAEQALGNGGEAAKYLNVLRERAARSGVAPSSVDLATATENDIFDEYARELCGEFSRWALLKRHHAFETRLPLYNTRAWESFKLKPAVYYNRPISQDFLSQISNKEQYGDNGYGTTTSSGLSNISSDTISSGVKANY